MLDDLLDGNVTAVSPSTNKRNGLSMQTNTEIEIFFHRQCCFICFFPLFRFVLVVRLYILFLAVNSDATPVNKDGGKKAKKFPKQVFYSPDLYSTVALDDNDTTITIINLM